MKTATSIKRKTLAPLSLLRFLFYAVYFMLIFGITFFSREPEPEPIAWLTLFGSFHRAWEERHTFIFWGIVDNFIMMFPLGVLLGWGKRSLSFWEVTFLAAAISLGIECTQYVTHLGYFDVDDILTNVRGAAAGMGGCHSIRELAVAVKWKRGPDWFKMIVGSFPFIAFLIFFGYFLLRMHNI